MTRRIVGPFNRVEGDLEVTLEIEGGRVAAAFVNAPLYRGFEQILEGKAPLDALVFVPRICGICSVAQSAAAARALADAAGIAPPSNGRLAANLTLAIENLADHLTHFYLFFMPDFAAAEYAGASWYAEVSAQFGAQSGQAGRQALAARARFMQAMGLLAGKWPHTLAVQPGGTTRPLAESELFRLQRIVREFRAFLEARLFGSPLETIAGLDGQTALERWRRQDRAGDLRFFLELADRLDLWSLGQSGARFLSVGAYDEEGGKCLFAPGTWYEGRVLPFDPSQVREDLSHARYASAQTAQRPEEERTVPLYDKPGAYSWCKAPRLGGEICETGALARQLVDGQPLVGDIVGRRGAGVGARVLARLLEFARVVPALQRWLDAFDPEGAWCTAAPLAENCLGKGFVEAARGALGHWLTVHQGRIGGYQIIAPTTWNFSPRAADGRPGALEQALVGLPVPEQGRVPAVVHHVVRSFDPCMVCTVH
ncbi:nickel-dependent hydrogenase large subunit [Sulfuricystis multivorans]|uniref:nickel-dependent hydrogenase large subunit n=1 Tax=Sulfuricystis multivorans TaxID=2211108 RepID=UPI000F833C31|nr:nickel-dependent hydrogenase large subunit [Sulfuricystis multivorans]